MDETETTPGTQDRRVRLRSALRTARAAVRRARRFPNALSRALRALGRVELALGRRRRAVRSLRRAAVAAQKLGVKVRIYYGSNAPELWYFTRQYRKNVLNLPFDEQSIVLQTTSGLPRRLAGPKKGYWHYNVMHGRYQQRLLERWGITRHKQLLYHRTKSESPELTLTGMPSR